MLGDQSKGLTQLTESGKSIGENGDSERSRGGEADFVFAIYLPTRW